MKHTKKFLALALAIISLFAIAAPALAATTGKYNTAAVHLRSSMGGTSLGLVSKGATCDILEAKSDSSGRAWYKVKITSHTANTPDLYNKTGWSWQQYIDVTGGTTPSTHPQTMNEAFGTGYLQLNSTGNYVRNVQLALHTLGRMSSWEIDGYYGYDTQSAVWDYQYDYQDQLGGMKGVDGIVGPDTKALLWSHCKSTLMAEGYK